MRRPASAVLASAALLLAAAQAAPAATFTVTYRGSGEFATRFKAHPPNPGGKDDHNFASDSSRQRWAIAFRRGLEIPPCGPAPEGAPDPCASVQGLSGATGPTLMTGRVAHRHVDGLYRRLDKSVSCRLRARTPGPGRVDADLQVRYVPETRSFAITALNPLKTVLTRFPLQCPDQGESIDRIFDFYATPGFSFADGFGPDPWFTSAAVTVPASRFQSAAKIALPLRGAPAGRPPRGCARLHPSYERCRTGGDWRGVLTFTKRSPAARAAALRRPSGTYTARKGRFLLSVAGRSIDIAAFDFRCRTTIGRTSLNAIAIKRARGRWRFSIRTFGSVTYSDDHPDENAKVLISGAFSRDAKRVTGTLEVRSPHCGSTGSVAWAARR
ncbi:MAG TPA: hypothetical protein VF549_06460 [Solirubrobacteraceae bacterium]